MEGQSKELIVCDEEYVAYETKINSLGTQIEGKLSNLIVQLQMVCNEGITSGSVHDNLQLFVDSLSYMSGQLTFFTGSIGECADGFVLTVEDFDDMVNGVIGE